MKIIAGGHVAAAALWIRWEYRLQPSLSMPKYYHFPPKVPFLVHGNSRTHLLTWWFLEAYEFTPKQHLNRFSRFFAGLMLVTLQQTDTYTEHATCVAVDCIRCYAMLCDLKVTLQHLARLTGLYLRPTSVTCIFMLVLLISSLKGGWLKPFAVSVWSNFDSIFKLLRISLHL